MKSFACRLTMCIGILCLAAQPGYAQLGRKASVAAPLFPVSPVVAEKDALEVYPFVSGNFLATASARTSVRKMNIRS